jgi:hypothetical protein
MESSCNRYGNVGAVRALPGWVLALVVAQGRNGCPNCGRRPHLELNPPERHNKLCSILAASIRA